MFPRVIRLGALAAALLTGAGAAESEACRWFGGGGWSAFRPLSWGSYYGPRTAFYGGGGWGGNWGVSGAACCASPCNACGTGAAGNCSSCGTASYYGGDACGACATGNSSYSSGYAPGTQPEPDPAGSRGTEEPPPAGPGADDFEGEYGTERNIRSNPEARSVVPPTPPSTRSSIPTNPPENRSSIPMTSPAGEGVDPFPGDDAPMWRNTPGAQEPAPQEPAPQNEEAPEPVTTGPEMHRIQPLDLEQPVASTYHVQRQRVSVRATYKIPTVARTVVGPNEGWSPVAAEGRFASSR